MINTEKKNVDGENNHEGGKLAVVLVRGLVRMNEPIKYTLGLLKLTKKNRCIIMDNTSCNRGMLNKIKDYVTWGEIDADTFKELLEKRGVLMTGRITDRKQKYNYNCLEVNGKKYIKYFNLNPPLKGFGRNGIKASFVAGGALGPRGEKINDLLRRMC